MRITRGYIFVDRVSCETGCIRKAASLERDNISQDTLKRLLIGACCCMVACLPIVVKLFVCLVNEGAEARMLEKEGNMRHASRHVHCMLDID